MTLHRTPHLAPDTPSQACSTLATASVFSCWMIWKFQGSEAGEESPLDKALVEWVGHPTSWSLLIVAVAA